MPGFPFIRAQGHRLLTRGPRRFHWKIGLALCALALPLSLHASERTTPMSAEAREWLGRSCTPQGCAPPRASAGMPLAFAGAVVLAAALAWRRGRRHGQNAPR